jgi:small GTP-binding protein
MADEPEATHKVVMLGNSGVGKTSIVVRFREKIFKRMTTPTVGAGTIQEVVRTQKGPVRLNIWDTAGEERYKSFAGLYSQAASAGVVCFDVTDEASFEEVGDWIRLFQENAEKDAILVLVGNKTDLVEERRVTEQAAKTWADGAGLVYFDVSAKTGENVDLLFAEIAGRVGPKMTTDCLALPAAADGPKDSDCGC